MKRFWKKQLPAFALALVMLAGLVPAALAAPGATEGGDCTSANRQHAWDSGKVYEEPTCVKKGTRVYLCQTCKKSFTEDIPATGNHDMQTVPGGTPATCVTPGYEKLKCSKCDAEGTKAIPATGKHTPNSNGVCTVCSQLVVTEADYCTVTFRAGSSTTTERVRKGSAPAGDRKSVV